VSEEHEKALERAGLRLLFYVQPPAVVVYLGEEYARMAPAYDTAVVTHGRLKKLIARGVLNAEAALAAELERVKAERNSLAKQAADMLGAGLRDARAEADRYRAALEEIRRDQGKVCAEFELCTHPACQSSYASWAIADAALGPAGEAKVEPVEAEDWPSMEEIQVRMAAREYLKSADAPPPGEATEAREP